MTHVYFIRDLTSRKPVTDTYIYTCKLLLRCDPELFALPRAKALGNKLARAKALGNYRKFRAVVRLGELATLPFCPAKNGLGTRLSRIIRMRINAGPREAKCTYARCVHLTVVRNTASGSVSFED